MLHPGAASLPPNVPRHGAGRPVETEPTAIGVAAARPVSRLYGGISGDVLGYRHRASTARHDSDWERRSRIQESAPTSRTVHGMAEFSPADDFLPVYDVSDAVATVADAGREPTWEALLDVDLIKLGREAPMVGMLGALRMLPEIVAHLIHGERPAKPPPSMRLRDLPSIPMAEGGWILLDERPGEEIALGLVGKFWRPVIEFARIESAEHFRRFDEPGFAKTVYDLAVRDLGPHRTLLSGLMRTATTDEHARRWFRRYWTFGVGSGAHILVAALLNSARRAAEANTGED